MPVAYNDAASNGPTFKVVKRPLPFRLANGFDKKLNQLGKSFVNLSEDFLMNAAIRRMKLHDWGGEDFRAPLKVLLDSCENEAGLDLFGRYVFSKMKVLNLLCNRLLIEDELKQHPDVLNAPIEKPLFIVSLPRTGTTLLHNLLFQDPANRCLRHWEAMSPSLHPKLRHKKKDPRIKKLNRVIHLMNRYTPELLTAHAMRVEGPEECHYLLGLNFVCEATFGVVANLPQYKEWVKTQSKIPTYKYYRKVLQLLQWHEPSTRWILKSPDHMSSLDALLNVFPDAGIVQIHRDPLKVIPSACSLLAISRGIHSPRVDLPSIGREIVDDMQYWLDQASRVRNSENADRFYDIHYKDLINSPMDAVQGIYDHFGIDFSPGTAEQMRLWLNQNRQHQKGVHRYSLAQFSLDKDDINKKFEPYRTEFHIAHE